MTLFSKACRETRSGAAELGEHTEAVLADIGGYAEKEIAQLKDEGFILVQPEAS